MSDINKHVARYFNIVESSTHHDIKFNTLHSDYSKAKAAVAFHHDADDNPYHPVNHADSNVSSAAQDHRRLENWDSDDGDGPSQETVRQSKQKLIGMHDDVKKHYDKADSLSGEKRRAHKAMWAHIEKHGTPKSFGDTSPNFGNREVMDKHYSSLVRDAEGRRRAGV